MSPRNRTHAGVVGLHLAAMVARNTVRVPLPFRLMRLRYAGGPPSRAARRCCYGVSERQIDSSKLSTHLPLDARGKLESFIVTTPR